MGADDFMAKPVDMDEFLVRVDRQLQRKKHLEALVLIDELTMCITGSIFNKRIPD